jgi:hypothetical protein
VADVLLYNSLNDSNNEYYKRLAATDVTIAEQEALKTAANTALNVAKVPLMQGGTTGNFSLWCLIPEVPDDGSSWTSGTTCGSLKVCDTTGYYRCGANCTWTVPSGASCARFQLWGAGAPSGSACCCGFSPIGGNGAYASVIMAVTPGNSYTLCAGCAYCCFATRSTSNADGCASYVTGSGLTNFCAEGGEGNLFCEAKTRQSEGATQNSYCMYLGACICNSGSDTCYTGGHTCQIGCTDNQWSNKYGFMRSCKTYFGSATGATVAGVNGMFSSMAVGHRSCTYFWAAPIYGFPTTSCCASGWNSSCGGCYRSAQNGYRQIPGVGGWGTMQCGGQTQYCGDAGRMGMVCVTWK